MSAGVKAFVDDHLDDPRNHPVNTYEDLYEGDIFYLLLIDDYDKLKPLYDLFKEDYYAVFDQEMYSHDWWLEVMSPDASKANAIKYLKQKLQCDEVVVFGMERMILRCRRVFPRSIWKIWQWMRAHLQKLKTKVASGSL